MAQAFSFFPATLSTAGDNMRTKLQTTLLLGTVFSGILFLIVYHTSSLLGD